MTTAESNRERNRMIFGFTPVPARGLNHGSQKKVVILIDDETFAEVRARAVKKRRSFAWVIRELVALGLETSKQ